MLKRLLVFLLIALLPMQAWSQASVLQGGSWSSGNVPVYSSSGSGVQPIIQNSGSPGGASAGIKELSIIARGTGTAPFVSQGTGQYNTIVQIQDAPSANSTGFHALSFSANTAGGGAQAGGLIAYNAYGGATPLPLYLNVNGTAYEFPFVLSGVVGPPSSTIGNLAVWNNTTGTLLADGGPPGTVVAANTRPCTPIEAYGGGTEVADNVAALNAFFATFGSGTHSGCVAFSAGRYTFLTKVTKTLLAKQGVSFMGAGMAQTQLYWPNANGGLDLTYTNVANGTWESSYASSFTNLSFITNAVNSGTGLYINGNKGGGNGESPTVLQNVMFLGNSSTTAWNIGAHFHRTSNVTISNLKYSGIVEQFAVGTAIFWDAPTFPESGVALNVDQLYVEFAAYGVHAQGAFEGITVQNSVIIRVNRGLTCDANPDYGHPQCNLINTQVEAQAAALEWFNVSGSQAIGNGLGVGVVSLTGDVIVMQGITNDNYIAGNFIVCIGTPTVGIKAISGGAHRIMGNDFINCTTGISYSALSVENIDSGNYFNTVATPISDLGGSGLNTHQYRVLGTNDYQQSATNFYQGATGPAWNLTTNSNGAILIGGAGKLPFIDFQCDVTQYCTRLQQNSPGIVTMFANNGAGSLVIFSDSTFGLGAPVNQVRLVAQATGSPAIVGAVGSDTNVDLAFTCQGTCLIRTSNRVLATTFLVQAALPTLSSCGTAPPGAAGGSANNGGQFTTGTATPTGCTVTFATAFPANAFCTVSPVNAAALAANARVSSSTASSFIVTQTATDTATYNYSCTGN